jgi:hypothetical protein
MFHSFIIRSLFNLCCLVMLICLSLNLLKYDLWSIYNLTQGELIIYKIFSHMIYTNQFIV